MSVNHHQSRGRHQLPAYSPLDARAVRDAITSRLRGMDARGELAGLLSAQYGADHVVLCSSGTDALQRAIRVAARGAERPIVALPAYSCYDVATAAVGVDARIVLYDIDPRTLQPDMDSLERAFRNGASVAVMTPLYGVPLDWQSLETLAAASGAQLVEDAAQGHGARWRSLPLGAHASVSVLSFGRGKGWTGGSGGALLLRHGSQNASVQPGHAGDARTLLAAAAQWMFGRPDTYGWLAAIPWLELGETIYHAPSPPRDMPRVAAMMALATHAEAEQCARGRRSVAAAFRTRLQHARRVRLIDVLADAEPGYLRFPVRVPGGITALGARSDLRRFGIMPGYPTPLNALPAVRARITGGEGKWRGADELVQQLVTLPTHRLISPAEQQAIIDVCDPAVPPRRTVAVTQHIAPKAVPAATRAGLHEPVAGMDPAAVPVSHR